MKLKDITLFARPLNDLEDGKVLITTLNAHSFNIAQKDPLFTEALKRSDILLPDGISVVWAHRWLTGRKISKIAGEDLFFHEMEQLQECGGSCFFLGSSPQTLQKIEARAAREYPEVEVGSYSPPYRPSFTEEDSSAMIEAVNNFAADVLFVGLTAPKQEKWAYSHFDKLHGNHICCIGAVFDFYAGTVNRAPQWAIDMGMEWCYRLLREPRRMWRRYLLGNAKFIFAIIKEKAGKPFT